MAGYEIFLSTRADRGEHRLGGGVALYMRKDIPWKLLPELFDPALEVIWAICKPKSLPCRFCCVIVASVYYLESTRNWGVLVLHLQTTIDYLGNIYSSPTFIIGGDFNQAKKCKLLFCLSLKQVVHIPTHSSGSILDLKLTNCDDFYSPSFSLGPIGMSDQNAILWKARKSLTRPKLSRVTVCPSTDLAICEYGRRIGIYDFPEVHGNEPLDTKVSNFNATSYYEYLEIFTTKSFVVSEYDKPWISPAIKSLIKERSGLYSCDDIINGKKLRNQIVSLVKKAKARYSRETMPYHLLTSDPKSSTTLKKVAGQAPDSGENFSNDGGSLTCAKEVSEFLHQDLHYLSAHYG